MSYDTLDEQMGSIAPFMSEYGIGIANLNPAWVMLRNRYDTSIDLKEESTMAPYF